MKKMLLLGALLAAPVVSASDYATNFTFGAPITSSAYVGMELDITRHSRYLAANGAIETASGLAAPVSGTCQFTTGGGVFCLLQSGFVSYIVDLGPNLSGMIEATDGNGTTFSSAAVTFAGME